MRGAGSASSLSNLLEIVRDFPSENWGVWGCEGNSTQEEKTQPRISVTLGYVLVLPHDCVSSGPHVLCIQALAFSISISSGRGEEAMEE